MSPARTRLVTLARVLLPVYLVAVGCVVFSPSDETTEGAGILAWLFDPLFAMRDAFAPGYVALEFVANIAMFVPFGVLVRLVFARLPWWSVLLLGFATTVSIELVQSTLPSRYSTVSDVVANTLGTAAGLFAVSLVRRRRARRR